MVPFSRAIPPSWCRTPAISGSCSPFPGTATRWSAPPTPPSRSPTEEPVATEREIDFVLSTAALYLAKKPTRSDVLSVFAGIRPLVRAGDAANTAALSRDHTIRIENSGMITICGGKWTTYRRMAEDCVNQAATLARLPDRPCVTETLPIHASEPLPSSQAPAPRPTLHGSPRDPRRAGRDGPDGRRCAGPADAGAFPKYGCRGRDGPGGGGTAGGRNRPEPPAGGVHRARVRATRSSEKQYHRRRSYYYLVSI